MEDAGKKSLAIVVKHAKPMVIELISEVAEQAIMDMAAKSENKVDDVLAAALLPLLKKALIDQIEKLAV